MIREYWAIADATWPEKCGGRVVGVSYHVSQTAVGRGLALRPETIPYGVASCNSVAQFSNSRFRVAYTGRMVEHQKRISLVIDAMIDACRRDSRVEGCVIGDGPEREKCSRIVEQAGFGDRIRFLGWLPLQEVRNELAHCQALILMSEFEGLPVSLLEAMTGGVVPVVRRIDSGVPELILDNETGLLVDDKPENAATAILRLANDATLWAHCSDNAKKLVDSRYNEETCHLKWASLLEETCRLGRVTYPIAVPRALEIERFSPLLVHHYPATTSIRERLRRKITSALRKYRQAMNGGQ